MSLTNLVKSYKINVVTVIKNPIVEKTASIGFFSLVISISSLN
jgi:hypothetical protein